MEVVKIKNIFDYRWVESIMKMNARFSAYCKGDDCTMFTVWHDELDAPFLEISIYGYSNDYFYENKVSDLLTNKSEGIVISENYHDEGKMFVYNSDY